ncbi:hypothetical protein [Saprospira grandis]|uniref:DUF7793 domain-containing protein n=1 Tax=Saprospira grandis (strain Lewin) TaxID=984262 RepID=H6L0G0_SAPGL|nr:hypothetical protein [Saprospira grandis]AFC23390.1 hypothetical protein SGRA_0651 [Saprospira grandis str. Lewin]
MKTTTTPLGKAEQLSDNLIKVTTVLKKATDIKLVQRHVEEIEEHFGIDHYYLSDPRSLISTTLEVRQYLANQKEIKAIAVLVKNGTTAMLANMFVSFSRPLYPTKVFKDETKAIAWLVSQGANAPKE